MSQPTVSIIIPTFNRASLAREAIESSLDQSYSSLEVIVVDDGSKDATPQTVKRFDTDFRFRYEYQENRGRSAARNRGIRLARGRYLLFLDSDDLLVPTCLESLCSVAEEFPSAGIIIGASTMVDEQGHPIPNGDAYRPETALHYTYPRVVRGFRFLMGSFIVRADVLDSAGLFDPTMEPCEDLDFYLRACLNTHTAHTRAPTARIRRHETNTPGRLFPAAGLRVAQKHLALIRDTRLLNVADRRLAESAWHYNMGDDFYRLGRTFPALQSYARSAWLCPGRIRDSHWRGHLARSMFPNLAREALKALFRRRRLAPTS